MNFCAIIKAFLPPKTLHKRVMIMKLVSTDMHIYGEKAVNRYNFTVLKRIFILGRIEYRILFVWWKLNESNIEYYSLIKKIFEYYSNTWKYSNIRIYSNRFAKNVKVSESKIFIYPENTFLIRKNFPYVDSHQ